MAAPLTNERPVSWPASPLSHIWKVLGFVLAVVAAGVGGFWPTPMRIDVATVAVAATRNTVVGLAAGIASLSGALTRHHDVRHVVAALVAVATGWLGAALLRRSPRSGTLPSRAAARLLPLVALGTVSGLIDHALLHRGDPLASSHVLFAPVKALAGLLIATVLLRGPRRGREAGPVFLTALVALLTFASTLATNALWERQDEALLHTTADNTKNEFLQSIVDQMNAITVKADSTIDNPLTPENFDGSMRPLVFGNQAIVAAQLLELQPDGSTTTMSSVTSLGADFEIAFQRWNEAHGDKAAAAHENSSLTYSGLASLPHPTLGESPTFIYISPLPQPPDRPRSAKPRVLAAAISVPQMLSSASIPTIAYTGAAVISLYVNLGDGKVLPLWSTASPAGAAGSTLGSVPTDAPPDVTGVSAVTDFLLNDATFMFVAKPGEGFGTPQSLRRLILLFEAGLGLFLVTMVLVNGDHRGRREIERVRREALLGAALEGSAGWTCIIDSHDRVVMSNSNKHALAPGNVISAATVWNGSSETIAAVNALVHGARLGVTGNMQHVWSDSADATHAMRIFEIDARPLPDPTLVYLQCADVTEHRDRAMRTAQSERMEAIGVLAGGLAHDFNNLLFITLGYLQMLERQPKINGDEQTLLYVRRAIEAVERGATVAKSLLSLARSQPLTAVPLNMREFLHDIKPLVEQALGPSHRLELFAAGDDLDVVVDPGRLSSSLLNIVFNARDAMETSGTLEIRAEHCVSAAVGGEAVPAVALSVRDTGKGMSPDVLSRAFEPFFTTNRLGSGTGLGLSTVYSFAQQSGGWATIDSAEGAGSTVTIFLPPALNTATDSVPSPRPRTATKALVVDDEVALADLVASWLEDLGMETQVANNPDDALRVAASFRPELLISDANLGAEIDGLELARQLVEKDPSLLVIFMTGFSERIKALQAAGVATLAKPFSREDLAANVGAHLGERFAASEQKGRS